MGMAPYFAHNALNLGNKPLFSFVNIWSSARVVNIWKSARITDKKHVQV